jgi:hypothetical protein
VPLPCNLGTLTSWNPLGHSRTVTGLLYLYLYLRLIVGVIGKLTEKNFRPKRPLPKITTKFPAWTGKIRWTSVALTGVLAEFRSPSLFSSNHHQWGTSQKMDSRQKSGGNLRCQRYSRPLLLRCSAQSWRRYPRHKLVISKFTLGVTLPCLGPLLTAAAITRSFSWLFLWGSTRRITRRKHNAGKLQHQIF